MVRSSAREIQFELGEEKATVRVNKGKIERTGPAVWARRYLLSEDATEIVLSPDLASGEATELHWQVDQA